MRTAAISRKTKETQIEVRLNLDGTGRCAVHTGIGFFDHMLEQIARHGLMDLDVKVEGDLYVDGHHTVEDAGIVLGQALKEALGEKKGIVRYGQACIPLDESLSRVVLDLSGRPGLYFDCDFTAPMIGALDSQLVREFFQAVSNHAGMTLHIDNLKGENAHHQAESIRGRDSEHEGRTMKIAIVDYGTGNLRSVGQAVRAVADGADVSVTQSAAEIDAADRVIFPGQGAMGDCMRCLGESGLKDAVLRALANKPVLAVCIGMQMLFERSDENDCAGLGLMAGKVIRFPQAALVRANGERLKVPQMGWNTVTQRMAHPLWDGIADKSWFYFVHSYFVAPEDDSLAAGTSSYGLPFVCAVARDNIFATQFHPEKSAASGLKLFSNFVHWDI